MKIHILLLLAMASLMAAPGCAIVPPSQQQIAGFDYGEPLTLDYQEVIKKRFDRVVNDPVATLYTFSPPEQYWFRDSPLQGGKIIAGYAVKVDVNARNSLGGETGYQHYMFIFHNNAIVKVLTPADIRVMNTY